jgi:hypothetical protein
MKENLVRIPVLVLSALLACSTLDAQQRRNGVDMRNTHQRVIAVVPIIGAGTPADPRRPAYIPAPAGTPSRTGIIAFTWQASDDNKFALCEFVADSRAALAPILADKSITVIFEKSKAKKDDVGNALKKFKKDFDPDKFGVMVP